MVRHLNIYEMTASTGGTGRATGRVELSEVRPQRPGGHRTGEVLADEEAAMFVDVGLESSTGALQQPGRLVADLRCETELRDDVAEQLHSHKVPR